MFGHMLMFACFTCFSVHTQPNLISNANVQKYAQVGHLGECTTFWMLQGRWESENNHPLPLFSPPPPPHSLWLTPSPSSSSSDTSSWQPAPFNSLQHSLGLGNHWCSAPSVANTPAPSLVELSHLEPYDEAFPRGVFLLPQTDLRCCEEK